jgi:hypothetical protein
MRTLSRRGFALVEVIIGLVTLSIFGIVAVALVTAVARSTGHATQALLTDRTTAALRAFLGEELRDAVDSDVVAIAATRVVLPRPIGEAEPCGASDTAVVIADSAWTGTRSPQAVRDHVWLLIDAVEGVWQSAAIAAVSTDRCPMTNAPAWRLSFAAVPGTPVAVRVMEPVELSAYRSGNYDWYGLAAAGGVSSVQPFAGPLTLSDAQFVVDTGYLDAVMRPARASAIRLRTPLGRP